MVVPCCQHAANADPDSFMTRSCVRSLLAGLLALLLVALGLGDGLQAGVPGPAAPGARIIPIQEQPFYPQLLAISELWREAPLGRVVGESPRETLLNFYAVMARVHHGLELTTSRPERDPGLFWSPAVQERISEANELFALAVDALDASIYPESVRGDSAQEAAIQLKELLDYVFTHSSMPIEIPDLVGLKALNATRSRSSESWTLPHTSITLTAEGEGDALQANPGFVFSATTVRHVGRMFDEIRDVPAVEQPFATPGFYRDFIHTPGFLAPPKWYLLLPPKLRGVLEMALDGQTLLQIVATLATLLLYGWVLLLLSRRLLHTYRYWQAQTEADSTARRPWHQDNVAWYRVLLVLPLLLLTRLSEHFIDDYVNFTGLPLVVVTYLFFICYFAASGFFLFFLSEALGRSISERLVRWRGGASDLQLRRVSNLVMPLCRALGALAAVVMIYRLLVALGLPSTTVLAFSAVPGLAIGLGASKLLGNLFGGLSIQTDRPLRVGEFCRIGDNLGFVTKIGLRSLELQTLESRVTIPNAIVDDETIVNFSRRQPSGDAPPSQSLAVRLVVTHSFSPEQVTDLLHFARLAVEAIEGLQQPLVSLEQEGVDAFTLLCHGLVAVQGWDRYLAVRECLLLRLEEVVEQVRLSLRRIGVSYETSSEQLERMPALIRGIVERDPQLMLQSCRLMTIADFSYDFSFRLHAHHASFGAFKDAINRLNHDLLACFASEGIEIPYPTAVEIQKDA
jgi:MscS family membrane protein